MINERYRLKLNESFSLRQGWLQKGVNIVKENPLAFKGSDAPIVFGIGSNMVKSLRYYLRVFSLIEDGKGSEVVLSELGESIYKYDRFLEDSFSLFILHLNSLMNKYINTVPYFYFNTKALSNSVKDEIVESIKMRLESNGVDVKPQMLNNDVQVLFRNYIEPDGEENPEENAYSSPLSTLSLIKKEGPFYKKCAPSVDALNPLVVFYNILLLTQKNELTLDEFLIMDNNPSVSLNLNEASLLYYLEILDKKGYIRLNKTAGLNTIKILKRKNISEIYSIYKEKESVQ